MFDYDSISEKELSEHFRKFKVENIVIAGANGGSCVNCSISGSLKMGYKVWTDGYAIIDFNFKNFIYPYIYEPDTMRFDTINSKSNFHQLSEFVDVEQLFLAPPASSLVRQCGGPLGA